jgi:hypothetical protein
MLVRDAINFVHFPRTGGWWVHDTLKALDVPFVTTISKEPHQPPLDSLRPSVTILRDPVSWWDSWLKFHARTGWRFFKGVKSDDLSTFKAECYRIGISYEHWIHFLLTPAVRIYSPDQIYEVCELLAGRPIPNELRSRRVNTNEKGAESSSDNPTPSDEM